MDFTVGQAVFTAEGRFQVEVPIVSVRHPEATGYIHKMLRVKPEIHRLKWTFQDRLMTVYMYTDDRRIDKYWIDQALDFIIKVNREVSIQLIEAVRVRRREIEVT